MPNDAWGFGFDLDPALAALLPKPTRPAKKEDEGFSAWWKDTSARYKLDPDLTKHSYDYRKAYREGWKPDESGHWPSDAKGEDHPNRVVGGFDTVTGKRVPGTKRASDDELLKLGWSKDSLEFLRRQKDPPEFVGQLQGEEFEPIDPYKPRTEIPKDPSADLKIEYDKPQFGLGQKEHERLSKVPRGMQREAKQRVAETVVEAVRQAPAAWAVTKAMQPVAAGITEGTYNVAAAPGTGVAKGARKWIEGGTVGEALKEGVGATGEAMFTGEHESLSEVFRDYGVELGPVEGLALDIATDWSNAIPFKSAAVALPAVVAAVKGGDKFLDVAKAARGALLASEAAAESVRAVKAGRSAFTPKAMAVANATSRAKGAVGERALVPRIVAEVTQPGAKVLDFGAGKDAAHAAALRAGGLDVTAHEFGANVVEGVHDAQALTRSYDTVYASNVLNVQSSPEMLQETVSQIAAVTKPGGRVIVNLPESPRKFAALTPELIVKELTDAGYLNITRIGGTNKAPVFSAIMGEVPNAAAKAVFRRTAGTRYGRLMDDLGHDFYHGSEEGFEGALDLSRASNEALYGPGLYATDSVQTATGYAGRMRTGTIGEDVISEAKHAGELVGLPDEPHASFVIEKVSKGPNGTVVTLRDPASKTYTRKLLRPGDYLHRMEFPESPTQLLEGTKVSGKIVGGANVRKFRLSKPIQAFDIDAFDPNEARTLYEELGQRLKGQVFHPDEGGPFADNALNNLMATVLDDPREMSNHNLYMDMVQIVEESQRVELEEAIHRAVVARHAAAGPEGARRAADDITAATMQALDAAGWDDALKLEIADDFRLEYGVDLPQSPHPKEVVNDMLVSLGYDAITHVGGGHTGNRPNRVLISLKKGNYVHPWGTEAGKLAAKPMGLMRTAGAGLGAATGAAVDDEHPMRGAVVGAAVGAAGFEGIGRLAEQLQKKGAKTTIKEAAEAVAKAPPGPIQDAMAEQADHAISTQPYIEHLIQRVPGRGEIIDMSTGASKQRVPMKMGSYDQLAQQARFERWLHKSQGVAQGSQENKLISKILEDAKRFYDHTRTVMPWSATEERSFEAAWKNVNLKPGAILNAEDTLSLRQAVHGASMYASELADAVPEVRRLTARGDTAGAQAILEKYGVKSENALGKLADQAVDEAHIAWRSVQGVRAEQGRALNALKIKLRAKRLGIGDDDFIIKAKELGASNSDIREKLAELKDPISRYAYLRKLGTPGGLELYKWYYLTSLLSGPATHARNLMSNAVKFATMDVAYPLERSIDVIRGRKSLADFRSEVGAMYRGQIEGMYQGWEEAMNIMRRGFSTSDAQGIADRPPEVSARALGFESEMLNRPGVTGALNSVSRFLEASDAFNRTVVFSGAMKAGLHRKATKLVNAGKLKPSQFDQFIREGMLDPQLMAPDVWKDAIAVAKDSVYRQDAGKALQSVMQTASVFDNLGWAKAYDAGVERVFAKAPKLRALAKIAARPVLAPATTIMPFIKTPAGVFKANFRVMGGGFLTSKWAKQADQHVMASVAKGEAMLGVMGAIPLLMMAKEGRITGAGPDSPMAQESSDISKAMDLFYADKRPHSILIGGKWIDYRSFGPFAMLLATVGNIGDVYRQRGGKTDFTTLAEGLKRNGRSMLSQSYLAGLMALTDAASDRTDQGLMKFLGRQAASFVPYSAALRAGRTAMDPVIREPSKETIGKAVWQNIQNTIPGLSTDVAPRIDYAGETIRSGFTGMGPVAGGIARAFSPVQVYDNTSDPVRNEMARLGKDAYLIKPPKSLRTSGGNPIALSAKQSAQLQRLVGRLQYQYAKTLIASPAYRGADTDDEKIQMLRDTMQDVRRQAIDAYRNIIIQLKLGGGAPQ